MIDGVIDSDENVAFSKIPNSRQKWRIYILETEMAEINTLYLTKTAIKTIPFEASHDP